MRWRSDDPYWEIEHSGDGIYGPAHPESRPPGRSPILIVRDAADNLIAENLISSGMRLCQPASDSNPSRRAVFFNRPGGMIRQVPPAENATLGRAGPQVPRLREGAIGEGLFISDDPVWADRRPKGGLEGGLERGLGARVERRP